MSVAKVSVTSISDLIGLIVESLRSKPSIRKGLLVISSILLLLLGALAAASKLVPSAVTLSSDALEAVSVMAFVSGLLAALAGLAYSPVRIGDGSFEIDLEELREERKRIQSQLEQEGETEDIMSTVHLSLNQLTEYYAINKGQARNSFRFSLFAIVLGLATVIGGVWFFLLGTNPNVTMAAITALCGCLIEFIGGSYLFIYNKSIDQLNVFYVQLIRTQNTMLAIKLSESVQDEDKRNEITQKIIHSLLSIDPSDFLQKIKRSKRTEPSHATDA